MPVPAPAPAPAPSCGEDLLNGVERMTSSEVMALARISRATLWRRIGARRFPAPIDRARQALFSKADVVAALKAEAAQPHSITVAAMQRLEAMRRRRTRTT